MQDKFPYSTALFLIRQLKKKKVLVVTRVLESLSEQFYSDWFMLGVFTISHEGALIGQTAQTYFKLLCKSSNSGISVLSDLMVGTGLHRGEF